MDTRRPYLIRPLLVPQPTWGGTYIARFKKWEKRGTLGATKIGQSYELYGKSQLTFLEDSLDESFGEEKIDDSETFRLTNLDASSLASVVGSTIAKKFNGMPILIKFTQALGNSFQLHRKPEMTHAHWLPKAESWYFLEKGTLTYGVVTKTIDAYKNACKDIERFMQQLSQKVLSGQQTVQNARQEAKKYIDTVNPWKYVHVHEVPQYTLLDLSIGGIHHSWEEDAMLSDGNIVYEVQQDVMDEFCTLRSFDQGKIKDDGSIRPISIDDYFAFLDSDETHNSLAFAEKKAAGESLLKTPYYSMDEVLVTAEKTIALDTSFAHLFVRDGVVVVETETGTVRVGKGHSCLVPWEAHEFVIRPVGGSSVVLKTYIQ